MPLCCYKGCNTSSKSKKTKTIGYRPFPKPITNLTKCLLWLELCANDKLKISNITRNTYVCEKHFVAGETNPTPYYEAAGEDPRKWKSLEVGRIIELGSNNEDEYMEIASSLENVESQSNGNDDHSYSKSNASVINEKEEKQTQTIAKNLFHANCSCNILYESRFSFESLSKSMHFKYFTGLTLQQFETFYTFLDPSIMPSLKYTSRNKTPIKSNRLRRFTDKDKLCLTLVRLKRGYTLKELSIFYKCSMSHVSVIFRTWIQFLYLQSCSLWNALFQGARSMERHEIPACFRVFDKNVTAVLGVTEVRLQMSKNFQRQGNTFSKYKHNSVKFLVGVSTKGAIIYASEGYEGSISDTELFRTSDIVQFLEEGDVLMVDRGFTIQDICDQNLYTLLIPPFLAGRCKLTAEEEILTKKIAKGRIHVEKTIQRIKNFKILSKPIPITMLPLISNMFSVICFIVNFEEPLVT